MQKMEEKSLLDLTCEYQAEPLGVQNMHPRFGWKLKQEDSPQKSYRITVVKAENPTIILWDSGVEKSSRSYAVEYNGTPLESKTIYCWSVSVVLQDDMVYEATSQFETGIFNMQEWQGEWIQQPNAKYGMAPLFRYSFQMEECTQGRIYICGIGYYELYINGQRIGDHELDPGWTDYGKRVLYETYDVTGLLRKGMNVIGVTLGEGWYGNLHEGFIKLIGKMPEWYGSPKFLCNLEYHKADGRTECIATKGGLEGGWICCDGPIVNNNVYDGEYYDARLEKDGWTEIEFIEDQDWKPAMTAQKPCDKLVSQMQPPIRAVSKYEPKYVAYAGKSAVVYDLGENIAGWASITVSGQAGQKVTMGFGEVLDADGLVMQENLRNAKAVDTYIMKGNGQETYQPRFTYHGFRYVQVDTDPGVLVHDFCGYAVHSDVSSKGKFECSNVLLNNIQKAMIRTELNNLHSVPTDCPQRDERLAWLNDMTVRFEEALYNFDLMLFYEKWLDDIADAQDEETGCIPDTAPFFFGGKAAFHISSVYVLLPWFLYQFYGDSQPLKKHYQGMKRYVEFKRSQLDAEGLIDEQYFGEWAPPMTECLLGWGENAVPNKLPKQLVTTGYLYYDYVVMEKIARLLEVEKDVVAYATEAELTKNAINKKYWNPENKSYEPNLQGCNVFPLFLDIVPEGCRPQVMEHLLKDLVEKREYHISTGNQLTKYLYEVLNQENQNDVALKVSTQTTYPSIGYMLECGATTIWERWENMKNNHMNSHDHPMLGAYTIWFYKALAGFTAEQGMTDKTTLKPSIVEGLDYVTASYETVTGMLESSWSKKENQVLCKVSVPWNMKVNYYLPENADWESLSAQYKKEISAEGKAYVVLSSGNYQLIGNLHK